MVDGDVVGKDGEVRTHVAVAFVAVAVLVDAAGTALAVEHAVEGMDGRDVGRADAPVVAQADARSADAALGRGDDPFAVFRAEHDGVAVRCHPADGGLGGCAHGEQEARVVCRAGGEVVEVVGAREPEGLRLGGGGGKDEPGVVEGGLRGVAVPRIEGAPAPVVAAQRGVER